MRGRADPWRSKSATAARRFLREVCRLLLEELKLKTQLRTASALTEVGNYYKQFGLNDKAKLKYAEALSVCEKIRTEAREVGGKLLEETYVQLWRIYLAMD